jgi:hypothetical protein
MSAATRSAAAALLGIYCFWTSPALAQMQAQAPSAPSTSEAHPFVAEIHTGLNDPLGQLGLALVYDRGGRFSGGLGLGLGSVGDHVPVTASLFGRARLLRLGIFSLDTGAILSRGNYRASRTYSPPAAADEDHMVWEWSPDYRLTGTLAAGLVGRRWSLRVEGGLAYHLNRPTCGYSGFATWFQGDCDSQYIPDAYHFSREPGRISASLSLTLGYRMGVDDDPVATQASTNPDYRSPGKAQRLAAWSTAVPVLLGLTMLKLGLNNQSDALTIGAFPVMGLGISFGPSIGYAYAGENFRGWGMGIVRALVFGAGALMLRGSTSRVECENCGVVQFWSQVFGYSLMGLAALSTVYDLFTVHKAARRTNAACGLTNVSLLPAPIAGSKSVGPGLALAGQF